MPFLPLECRELDRRGVNGRSAFRFCGTMEGVGEAIDICGGVGPVEETKRRCWVTSRSGWNSWYGRSSRGLREFIDRGTCPECKFPASSRASEPVRLLRLPDLLPGARGAITRQSIKLYAVRRLVVLLDPAQADRSV